MGGGGAVLDTPIENQRFVYDVNVEGVYRTTRAFAPLIMESKGRIVTTGSIAGTISWAGGSAYAGSKHWIEAYTDALAGEMEPHGVSVSVVEPGNYKSRIRRGSWERAFEQMEAAGEEVTEEMKQAYKQTADRELSYKEPDEVTAAFMHALFYDKPLLKFDRLLETYLACAPKSNAVYMAFKAAMREARESYAEPHEASKWVRFWLRPRPRRRRRATATCCGP